MFCLFQLLDVPLPFVQNQRAGDMRLQCSIFQQSGNLLHVMPARFHHSKVSMLLHSEFRIGEIAREFNFTDESPLNRIFKKYKEASPSAYRKARKPIA